MSDQIISLVIWYAREGLGRHVQVLCSEAIRRKRGDAALQLWKGYGLCLEGSYSEALRELQSLASYQEVALPRILLQIHAHKQARVIDEETLQDLEFYLPNEEKSATERALYFSAVICWLIGETRKAKDYCNNILRVQPSYYQATTLLGWMCDEGSSSSGRADLGEESMPYFEKALSQGTNDVLAFLGKALYFDLRGDSRTAIQSLTEVGLHFPWFFPVLSEKVKLLVKVEDWEQASEDAQKLLQKDSKNLDGHLFDVFHLLAREGRTSMGLQRFEELCDIIDSVEPRNPRLLWQVSSLISRISVGNTAILEISKELMKKACKLAPESSEYLAEQASQLQLLGEYKEAISLYTQAGQLHDMNPKCLFASLQCQILLGHITKARSQLNFLREMTSERDSSVELHLCEAVLMSVTSKNLKDMLSLVHRSFEAQIKSMVERKAGYDTILSLNPPLLLQMAQLLLNHCPSYPDSYMDSVQKDCVKQCLLILETLTRYAPGIAYAQLLQAKCYFLLGNLDGAKSQIAKVLRLNPTDSEARVLLGQMHIHENKSDSAFQELENAVSHNFQIRNNVQYKIAMSKIHAANLKYEEAKILLMELLSAANSGGKEATSFQFGLLTSGEVNSSDLSLIYLQLIEMYSKLGKVAEASETMKEALHKFKGTSEEMKIIIAECNLLLHSGNVRKALGKLENVGRDSPYFATCRTAIADIYLNRLGNREKYAQCYMEIADKEPSVKNLVTLGEAFMQIQDPARAISAYENALRLNPRDGELPSKIGEALISTHDFHRAVDYYERSVRNDPTNLQLQYELAELYFKLQRYDEVRNLCQRNLKSKEGERNFSSLKIKVNLRMLLHSMYKEIGDKKAALESLILAKEDQARVIQACQSERAELYTERRMGCKICHMIGLSYSNSRMHAKAVEYFDQARTFEEGNIAVMLNLAKTHLATGNADICQKYCSQVLRLDHNHEQATMMLAELLFQKEDCETAIFHFQQILGKKPCHYQALCQMIHLLRRTGKLKEVQTYIEAAENENVAGKLDAGLHFCKGLYMKYMKNPSKAISIFNLARKDRIYGTQAILNMIEIYLNPSDGGLWEDKAVNSDDISAASVLIKEIKNHSSIEKEVLESYILMASKSKPDIDKALEKLISMSPGNQDNVPVLLAMATAFSLLKQTPKARNQLKRIAKMNYSVDDAEAFEQAWLLLVEIYVQGGKYDLAQDLAKKCIKYNKSCGKVRTISLSLYFLLLFFSFSSSSSLPWYSYMWLCRLGNTSA